ncbi:hypothetical protein ACS0TY_025132 [Phlomoides rotata]
MSHILGCTTSRSVWTSLDSSFHHTLKSRELLLKDDLQLMKKMLVPFLNTVRTFGAYVTNYRLLDARWRGRQVPLVPAGTWSRICGLLSGIHGPTVATEPI